MRFSEDAIEALARYRWPGNVRELSNLIERLAVLYPGGLISVHDLPVRYRGGTVGDRFDSLPLSPIETQAFRTRQGDSALAGQSMIFQHDQFLAAMTLPQEGIDLRSHMARIELNLIQTALACTQGVVTHAAQLLGLRRTTLVEKLRKYGIDRESMEVEAET